MADTAVKTEGIKVESIKVESSGRSTPVATQSTGAVGSPATSTRTPRVRGIRDAEIIALQNSLHMGSATGIAEYRWPPNDYYSKGLKRQVTLNDDATLWMVQEQVGSFLNITSFKRKYPDVERRRIDGHEADWLKDHAFVNEAHISLGLTAIRATAVHELMQRDYPEKYEELLVELAERETREFIRDHTNYATLLKKKAQEMKDNTNLHYKIKRSDGDRTWYELPDLDKQANKDAFLYSKKLGLRRQHIFNSYYDENTNTMQFPREKKYRKVDPNLTRPDPEYPCAVIPGQYSAYFVEFKPEELKYLPLGSVLQAGNRKGHKLKKLMENPPKKPEGPPARDDLEALDIAISESETSGHDSDEEIILHPSQLDPGQEIMSMNFAASTEDDVSSTASSEAPMICSICGKDEKWGYFVYCSNCKRYGHVECLQLSTKVLAAIRTYKWQCMECKVCVVCFEEKDEENLLFCDRCDRGSHTHCVGLTKIPRCAWLCERCSPFEEEYQLRISQYKEEEQKLRAQQKSEKRVEKKVPEKKDGRGRPPKGSKKANDKQKVKETSTRSGRKSKGPAVSD